MPLVPENYCLFPPIFSPVFLVLVDPPERIFKKLYNIRLDVFQLEKKNASLRPTYRVAPKSTNTCWQPTREATASVLPGSAAATGRLFWPAPARRLSLLVSLGWAGAAPKPHAGSSDGDTGIELLCEVVTGWCSCGSGLGGKER